MLSKGLGTNVRSFIHNDIRITLDGGRDQFRMECAGHCVVGKAQRCQCAACRDRIAVSVGITDNSILSVDEDSVNCSAGIEPGKIQMLRIVFHLDKAIGDINALNQVPDYGSIPGIRNPVRGLRRHNPEESRPR